MAKAKAKTTRKPTARSARKLPAASARRRASAAPAPSRRKVTPTKRKKPERLIATKSQKSIKDILRRNAAELQPRTEPPSPDTGVSIDVKITQEDIDAQLLLAMMDSNTGLLANLHGMALEGKKWLAEEPEKANLFLSTAKQTASYRPLKLLFEMMELDEEILKVPPPSEQSKKSIQSGFANAVALGNSFASLLKSFDQVGLDLNLDI